MKKMFRRRLNTNCLPMLEVKTLEVSMIYK